MAVLCIFAITVHAAIIVDLPYSNVRVENARPEARFSGTGLNAEPGQPLLPVYSCAILLPPDADLSTVSFSVKGLREEILNGYTVAPAQPPLSINGPQWPENRAIVEGKDIGVYGRNAVFPQEHILVSSNGRMYCYKIVQVQVNLARYNPVTGELLKMTGGQLVASWQKDPSYTRSASRQVRVPLSVKKRAQSMVVNYADFAAAYDADFTFDRASKMVIITTSAIKTGSKKLTDFVASKAMRGVEATVVTDWGTSAANLRTWLQSNYKTMGLEYVLLIGHYTSDVPMMDFPSYSGSDNCPSDWPFAQLDGTDYKSDKTCELHVGRIPIYNNNLNTLDSILTKTIAYESSAPADIVWRKNALFCGPGYNSGSNMACVPLNAVYADFVQKLPPWKAYRIYGTTYGQPTDPQPDEIGTESAVVAKWKSSSFGLVDWATHGSPSSASYVLSSSNTANIGNKYPAYVFCGSCSNASPSSATNLSYSILKNCGIGAIGGTDLTYYGGDYKTSGSDNAWAYYFGKFMIGDSMDIGNALTALREMAPSSFNWLNRAPYVLYGDPTLGILTCRTNTAVYDVSLTKQLTYELKFQNSGISFYVPENGKKQNMASIRLYSLQGRLVRTLWRGNVAAGHHFIYMNDGSHEKDNRAAGLYLCTLESQGIRKTIQVVIQGR